MKTLMKLLMNNLILSVKMTESVWSKVGRIYELIKLSWNFWWTTWFSQWRWQKVCDPQWGEYMNWSSSHGTSDERVSLKENRMCGGIMWGSLSHGWDWTHGFFECLWGGAIASSLCSLHFLFCPNNSTVCLQISATYFGLRRSCRFFDHQAAFTTADN